MPARKDVPPKTCANCGLPMARKRYGGHLETPQQYAARKTCGLVCRDELSRKQESRRRQRECGQCGSPIRRKVFPCGVNETTHALNRRRFCDAECAALYAEDRGLRVRFLNRWRHQRNQERAS